MSPIRRSHGYLLPPALLVLAMACASGQGVQATRDDTADFSRYRSWSWLADAREKERPLLDVERELSALVQERILREFAGRGFHFRRENADLGVEVRLDVDREQHIIYRNLATQSLHSFHASPSYEIQGAEREVVTHERGRLAIRVLDLRAGREVWRGEYAGRFSDAFTEHVAEAVASTLESFPTAATASSPFEFGKVARRP